MDPFSIQTPSGGKPVHSLPHDQFTGRQTGYILEDYTLTENNTPYIGRGANETMFRIATILIFGIIFIFTFRAAYLQILKGGDFLAIADGNRYRMETISPKRGLFLDRNNVALVYNTPRFVLSIRPSDATKEETMVPIISLLEKYQISEETIRQTISDHQNSSEWISIKEPLEHREAIELIAATSNYPALSVRTETRRDYQTADARSLSHVLGYVGKPTENDLALNVAEDGIQVVGKSGLEAQYNSVLQGVRGRKQIEVDALGHEKQIIAKEDPINGTNLILGLDFELQKKAERVLTDVLKTFHKTRASIVIIDPQNGEIRTLISWPSFDGNDFSSGISNDKYAELMNNPDRPLFPRAISGTYPSGSIIKPIFAAAALEEGIITPTTTVLSTGGIQINQWFFPDWKAGGHGAVNVYSAIANSVNTFFYYIGGGYGNFEGLGPDRLSVWSRRFGLGAPTDIDLPGEAAGFIPTRDWKENVRNEPWYIGDTYHFAIGQGDVLVTPLQMASATATIANGGTRYAPHLVHATVDPDETIHEVEPRILDKDFISSKSLEVVRNAMRQTVTDGSAKLLQSVPVAVAGKTGTAQWKDGEATHAWFTGFAPLNNPELAITVLVEEGGEGSTVAVPIARDILTWYFNNK